MPSWSMRAACLAGGPLLLALALAGCDAAPGPPSMAGRPPVVSELAYTPTHVLLDDVEEARLEGDAVRVTVAFEVRAADADGDLQEVGYVIRSPLAGRPPLESGAMAAAGGGRYAAEVDLLLPKAEVGLYTVLVYALDREGRLGNEVRGAIRYMAEGGPPVVEAVEASPDVVRPPTSFTLVATVSDPDGLSNIARVFGKAPNGSEFSLFDDGRSKGDETAGDGRFTAEFDVPSATPGVQTFTIQAVDLTGLESEPVEKQITVE